jgi:seryl-tRNA synthetase
MAHPKVPSEMKVLETFGQKPDFMFLPKDHLEISETLDLVDFESAAIASGKLQ